MSQHQQQQQRQYLVPRKVTTRLEFLPGFGIKEAAWVVAGAAAGLLWYKVTSMIGAPAFVRIVSAVLPPAIAFYLVIGEDDSLASRLMRAKAYRSRPQRLTFQTGTGTDVTPPTLADSQAHPLKRLLAFLGLIKSTEPPIGTRLHPSVQAWLPVRDVSNQVLLRRDGSLVAGIQIEPINLSLCSPGEQARLISALHEAINAMDHPAQIISIPRPLDLDGYLKDLEARVRTVSPARQQLLGQHIRYVGQMAAGGEAQERRFYVLIPREYDGRGSIEQLMQQTNDLAARLTQASLRAHILTDMELFGMLHVWAHPDKAAVERPPTQGPAIITRLEGGKP